MKKIFIVLTLTPLLVCGQLTMKDVYIVSSGESWWGSEEVEKTTYFTIEDDLSKTICFERSSGKEFTGILGFKETAYYESEDFLELQFVNGMAHGKYSKTNANGQVIEEGNYKKGLKDGKWVLTDFGYYDTTYTETNYRKGMKHGDYTEKSASSLKSKKKVYLNGRLKNVTVYNDLGFKSLYEDYRNGLLHGKRVIYDDRGYPLSEEEFQNGNGIFKSYDTDSYPEAELIEEYELKFNVKNGYYKRYRNGQLIEYGNYIDDEEDGEWKKPIEWNRWLELRGLENDDGYYMVNYISGEPTGKLKEYYANGIQAKEFFLTRVDEDAWSNSVNGPAQAWDRDGNLVYEGIYKDNLRKGLHKFYNYSNGKQRTLEVRNYIEGGILNGEFIRYDIQTDTVLYQTQFINGSGYYKEHEYESNCLIEEGEIIKMQRNGDWNYYEECELDSFHKYIQMKGEVFKVFEKYKDWYGEWQEESYDPPRVVYEYSTNF